MWLKKYCLLRSLSVATEIFEKILNNKLLNHCKKGKKYKNHLVIVQSDKTSGGFNMPSANQVVVREISNTFDGVWYSGLLHKRKLY